MNCPCLKKMEFFHRLRYALIVASFYFKTSTPCVPPCSLRRNRSVREWHHHRGSQRSSVCCLLFCSEVLRAELCPSLRWIQNLQSSRQLLRKIFRKILYRGYYHFHLHRAKKRPETWNGCSKRITPWVREEEAAVFKDNKYLLYFSYTFWRGILYLGDRGSN